MKNNYICGSYIPSAEAKQEDLQKINFNKITHVFIAFSTLHRENDLYLPQVGSDTEQGLRLIQKEIARQKASCKMLISIGGAGAGFFCEASSNEENRKAFALRCAEFISRYSLDGIDLDWEFPGLRHLDVSACDHCVSDFTLLCRAIREEIGGKLLTSAMGSDHWNRLENTQLNKLLDYAGIMTYDMDEESHSKMSLTKSAMEGWAANGFDREKLLLGVPFYARSRIEKYNWMGYDIIKERVINGDGKIFEKDGQSYAHLDGDVMSIDTPEAIKEKVSYLKEQGFGGIFCWQELSDYNGELRDAMYINI